MIHVSLWDGISEFERHVEIADSKTIPEILIVDERHYIRYRESDTDLDGVVRYRLAVGRHTIYTQGVPIYVAKLFDEPLIIETPRLRLFSGCHGASPFMYDQEMRPSWKERILFQVRGLTAFRINGVWCPELVRNPGVSNERAALAEQAASALEFARQWKAPDYERPIFRLSAVGIDEYGRLICDLSKVVVPKLEGETKVYLFAKAALESGLFLPSRLAV